MSRIELIIEIERKRAVMVNLAESGGDYADVLKVSHDLDRLIVEFYRTAA